MARVTHFQLHPRLLRYATGRYFKGEIDRLRRCIKARRAKQIYVYVELPKDPVTLVLATEPVDNVPYLDLIGVYDRTVTAAMLREDLPYQFQGDPVR